MNTMIQMKLIITTENETTKKYTRHKSRLGELCLYFPNTKTNPRKQHQVFRLSILTTANTKISEIIYRLNLAIFIITS